MNGTSVLQGTAIAFPRKNARSQKNSLLPIEKTYLAALMITDVKTQ
jgi:hypothetical protein